MCKEEMMDELEEFCEAAGFADFNNKVLKDMDEKEIETMHNEVYKTISDEEWYFRKINEGGTVSYGRNIISRRIRWWGDGICHKFEIEKKWTSYNRRTEKYEIRRKYEANCL